MENEKLFERIYLESRLKYRLTENEYEQFQEGKLKNALIGLSILGATLGMASCSNLNNISFDVEETGYEHTVDTVNEDNLIKFIPSKENNITSFILNNLDKNVSTDQLLDLLEGGLDSTRAASSVVHRPSYNPNSTSDGVSINFNAKKSYVDELYRRLLSSHNVDLKVTTKPDSIDQEGIFIELGNSGDYILVLGKYQISDSDRAASSVRGGNNTFIMVDEDGDKILSFDSTDIDEAETDDLMVDTSFKGAGILIYHI